MMVIGCDYHPGFQQIAYVNTATGEVRERRLGHKQEAEQFYRELRTRLAHADLASDASSETPSCGCR